MNSKYYIEVFDWEKFSLAILGWLGLIIMFSSIFISIIIGYCSITKIYFNNLLYVPIIIGSLISGFWALFLINIMTSTITFKKKKYLCSETKK